MPFYGKHSAACQRCRIRRVKCDLQKPSCKQCQRLCISCPGYAVVRSNVKRAAKHVGNHSENASSSPTGEVTRWVAVHVLPLLRLRDLAECHFVANYLLSPQPDQTRGYLGFLVPLVKEDKFPHLRHAYSACALASFNSRIGHNDLLDRTALSNYTAALAAVSRALRDPDLIKHDSTLAAVLLLSFYEIMSARRLGTMSWGSHIEGARKIVELRGPEQLQTEIGIDMFITTRSHIICHELSIGASSKPLVGWIMDDPRVKGDPRIKNDPRFTDPPILTQQLKIRVKKLKSEVTKILCSPRTEDAVARLQNILQRCKEINGEFENCRDELPPSYEYTTVAWEYDEPHDLRTADVFPGRIDLYQDLWAAAVWNVLRITRVILMAVMVRCVEMIRWPDDYRTTPEYALAASVWNEVISDIFASVPYLLGWFTKNPHLLGNVNLSKFACGHDSADKALGGFLMLWPLACLQAQDYLSDRQRRWVQGRLEYIGTELGVRTATALSQLHKQPNKLMTTLQSMQSQEKGVTAHSTKDKTRVIKQDLVATIL